MEEINSQNSDLGLQDLDKLEAKAQAENTKRATNWGIKKFEKWCDKRKLKVDFNCVTPAELNQEKMRDREGEQGRWPRYVNFTKVIF